MNSGDAATHLAPQAGRGETNFAPNGFRHEQNPARGMRPGSLLLCRFHLAARSTAKRAIVLPECFEAPPAATSSGRPQRTFVHCSSACAIIAVQVANPIAGTQTGTVTCGA